MLNELEKLQQLESIIKDFQINLTEDKMLDLLQIKYRWRYDTVEFINHAGNVNNFLYDIDEHLNYEKFLELYNLGFPAIIPNIMDITSDLRELNKKLFKHRGCLTNGNLYFSSGSADHRPSFDLHSHDYDVIVKSMYGPAKWQVGVSSFMLLPGETVIIPKGTVHGVLQSTEPRLSLTLNMSS